MNDCATCGKTAQQLKDRGEWWECSHVECPGRKPTVGIGNRDSYGFNGGSAPADSKGPMTVGSEGCYRTRPALGVE